MLHYADIFAGTGRQDLKEDEQQISSLELSSLDGSVSQMVEKGKFNWFHFNDISPAHCEDLKQLVEEKGIAHRSRISCCDANQFICDFVSSLKWNDRVLMFIDPYSTQLEWNALRRVAESEKIDAILLFPISPVLRLLPKEPTKLLPSNRATLNRLWGEDAWEEELYQKKAEATTGDLFDFEEEPKSERVDHAKRGDIHEEKARVCI